MPLAVCTAHCWVDYHFCRRFVYFWQMLYPALFHQKGDEVRIFVSLCFAVCWDKDDSVALACPWWAEFRLRHGAKLGSAPGLCAPVISEGMPLAVCRAHCWVDYHCTPRFVVPVRFWPWLKSDMLVALACPWCARFIDYLNGAKLGNALRLCAPVLG
jgi:hypothetical protein